MTSTTKSLLQRLLTCWNLKILFGTVLTVGFWLGYFTLQQVTIRSVVNMPNLWLDHKIPFWPEAAFIYVSQFFTMPIIPWLLTTRRELFNYCKGVTLIGGVSFCIFLIYPTTVLRPLSTVGFNGLYQLVVSIDSPRNAFPSLHAAFGVYTACWAPMAFRGWQREKILTLVAWISAITVILSALLTKQHVVLDIVAGGLIGYAGYKMGSMSRR